MIRMARREALLLLLVTLLAACGQGAPTPAASDGSSAGASGAAPVSSTTGGSPGTSGRSPDTGRTDTDWGRIWDAVPTAFPVYPGAVPSDEAQTEPVSATFTIAADDARGVAAWMQAELERNAYRTEALNGPMEDGGFIIESTGDAGCRIQVAVTPLGGMTIVTVRYGADCPSP